MKKPNNKTEKNSKKKAALSRRKLLKKSAIVGLGGSAAMMQMSCDSSSPNIDKKELTLASDAQISENIKNRKFLIVLTASGGGSIIDSAMSLSAEEVRSAGGNPDNVNCFSDQQLVSIPGSNIRATKIDHSLVTLGGLKVETDQSQFVRNNFQDMTVITSMGTSVNHTVAQIRCLNGNHAWQGRTIQEAVAQQYGSDLPIANLNMGAGAYGFAGEDPTLERYAQQYHVSNPLYWPLGLSAKERLQYQVDPKVMDQVQKFRNDKLDKNSNFFQSFRHQKNIRNWLHLRNNVAAQYEKQQLMKKLFFHDQNTDDSEIQMLHGVFPDYETDPLEAQAVLAYLAITRNISCVVTLGPSSNSVSKGTGFNFVSTPIAFDFSHNDHRGTQAMMWSRIYSVTDRLINLLKTKEYGTAGGSYWDRSMVYVASEFGRSKNRSSGNEEFQSGHDLNNGSIVISPMIKGNRVLGGIDKKTGHTFGFDLKTGAPTPNKVIEEKAFFSTLVSALDVDKSGTDLDDVQAIKT